MSLTRSLQQQLFESVFTHEYRREGYRIDSDRFPSTPSRAGLPRRAASRLKGYLWNAVFRSSFEQIAASHFREIACHLNLLPRIEALYEKLGDEHSREMLHALMTYRLVGRQRYALPLNKPEYWRQREDIRKLVASDRSIRIPFQALTLMHHDVTPLGFPIQLFNLAAGIQPIFVLEQYRYKGSIEVGAEPGDYVLDAGGCWGEVALYFAHRVGPSGRVFSFEFIPDNTKVFRESIALNPGLADRIELVEQPVWGRSGAKMHYLSNGPGSKVSLDAMPDATGSVDSVALSDFAARKGLPRVDFIKMDIEGAELEALRGAEALLRKHRPKLAISVYHRPDHLVAIPEYLESLDLGYEFYLDHFTTYMEETVLFATTARSRG